MLQTKHLSNLVTIDPDILGGTPVFKNTRVPVKTLFEYLQKNYSLEEFLDSFPSVTESAAIAVLQEAEITTFEQVG
ncbi:MAG: DUF433 domain-containing protein [Candidatus Kapaibacterium sp.]